MRCEVVFLCLGLAVAAAGCAKVKAAVCLDMVPAPVPGAAAAEAAKTPGKPEKPAEAAAEPAKPAENEAETEASEPEHTPEVQTAHAPQEEFALPFAWEKSPNEPLSRTRAFLRDLARDNGAYMKHGPDYFKAFAATQTPRVTLVSCADSRVQAGALDATPENDMFTVRNLGNQVGNGLGAIQYGIDHLHTPLLFVLGHTGCGAVKAAMTGTGGLAEPIKRELASMRVGKKKGKQDIDDKQWRDGVLRNVNDQVELALKTFAARVNAGQLTVIGAVYDFRNDLGKGPGKVSIINVNGVTEAPRLKAFQEAVLSGVSLDASGNPRKIVDPFERLSQVFAEHLHDQGDEEEEDEHETPHPKELPLAPVQHDPGPMFSPTPPLPTPAPPPAAHH
ncbi:MAG TPA: carbonic anhydrase [Polyangiales bacterium]|nr:carbonic anhydrase [Polyangiales bacterium]